MPIIEPERLARIVAAVHRYHLLNAPEVVATDDALTIAALNENLGQEGALSAVIGLVEREIFDAITPDNVLVIMEHDSAGQRTPILYCPDNAWAREFLEHCAKPEVMSVWEVPRDEAGGNDITEAFAERWMQRVADFTHAPDDFLEALPEFVRWHFEGGAMDAYAAAQRVRK